MEPGPDPAFYRFLQERHGLVVPVFDADVRVVIVVEPTNFIEVGGGLTPTETMALIQLAVSCSGSPHLEVDSFSSSHGPGYPHMFIDKAVPGSPLRAHRLTDCAIV